MKPTPDFGSKQGADLRPGDRGLASSAPVSCLSPVEYASNDSTVGPSVSTLASRSGLTALQATMTRQRTRSSAKLTDFINLPDSPADSEVHLP